jgi:GDPmannose 4,6-dehydratase
MIDALASSFKPGMVPIEIDPCFLRPTEVDYLLADFSKAKKEFGWKQRIELEQGLEKIYRWYV